MSSRRLPWLLAAGLALAVAMAPSEVRAQDGTFSSATGWMWGVSTFELTLSVGILVTTSTDICESWGCGVLALLVAGVAIGAGLTAGLLAGANDTPPDIPFAVHLTLWGALSGGLGGFAFSKLFASTESAATIAALSTAAVIGLGLGTYSLLRGDELFRERRTEGAAHFLAWGVTGTAIAALLAWSSLDIPTEGAAVLYALTTLIAYGTGIAWAETQIAKGDTGAATPLLTWGGTF
jgi:hypothetical protein